MPISTRHQDTIGPARYSRTDGLSAGRALLYGTLAVGILDGLDAVIFFGLRGAQPHRIFQSIASGILGRAAFGGGWTTVLLGLLLHFFIAFTVVLVYLLASRKLGILRRAPVICGLAYGVAVYLVMNRVVVPLSAVAASGAPAWPVIVNGVLIHMFGVGLPTGLIVAATRPPDMHRG